jgi:hypothetical protein
MKKIVTNLFLHGIKGFVLFSPSSRQTTHSLLLLKKLTTCLIFILFTLHLKSQAHLPYPYNSSVFLNYTHRVGVADSTSAYTWLHDINNINNGDLVIGKSTRDYNCHAFAWPCDQPLTLFIDPDGDDHNDYDRDPNGYYKAPYIYWGPSFMYDTTDEAHAEIAVFGGGDVAFSGNILHSAVRITNPNSTNLFINSHFNQYSKYAGWYVSKWGEGPLVIHKLHDCPDCKNNVKFFKKHLGSPDANNLKYKIDGPDAVCPYDATFTVPSWGFSWATWSCSGYLSIVTPSTTNSCIIRSTGRGAGAVTATVYSSIYGISSDTKQVTCLNGPPDNITSISTSQYYPGPGTSTPINVPENSWTHFYCFPFVPNDLNDLTPANSPDSHGATSYTWECNPSSYAQNPEPNNARSALIAFNQLYYYTLTATASNACGSRRYPQSIYVTGYFSLSPNPASSNVTVTMLKGNNLGAGQMFTNNILSDSTVETMLMQSAPEVQTNIPVTYIVKIVNSFGSLLYSSKKSGDTFTIPVDNLSKGNYLVQISDGKTVSSQTLIISR